MRLSRGIPGSINPQSRVYMYIFSFYLFSTVYLCVKLLDQPFIWWNHEVVSGSTALTHQGGTPEWSWHWCRCIFRTIILATDDLPIIPQVDGALRKLMEVQWRTPSASCTHNKEFNDDAHAGVSTECCILDFAMFALCGHCLSHQHLCILESKVQRDDPCSSFPIVLPQIIIEAKFTFDAFPRLPHVFTIIVFGDSWRMYWFPQNDLVMLYDEQMIYKDSRMVTCSIQQGHLNAQMP